MPSTVLLSLGSVGAMLSSGIQTLPGAVRSPKWQIALAAVARREIHDLPAHDLSYLSLLTDPHQFDLKFRAITAMERMVY
jgi:hypothetical protein